MQVALGTKNRLDDLAGIRVNTAQLPFTLTRASIKDLKEELK